MWIKKTKQFNSASTLQNLNPIKCTIFQIYRRWVSVANHFVPLNNWYENKIYEYPIPDLRSLRLETSFSHNFHFLFYVFTAKIIDTHNFWNNVLLCSVAFYIYNARWLRDYDIYWRRLEKYDQTLWSGRVYWLP